MCCDEPAAFNALCLGQWKRGDAEPSGGAEKKVAEKIGIIKGKRPGRRRSTTPADRAPPQHNVSLSAFFSPLYRR